MVPNLSRGHSFKGVIAYLSHDKREENPDGTLQSADTAERVGFTALLNFAPGEAVTLDEAAKVMAMTVRDAARLKRDAGVKGTGNKADAPPVWHMSLSWAHGEEPTQAEMIEAAHEALAAAGLAAGQGYQTILVEHTDTDHRHIHVVVNLTHPITGKRANPFRDQTKLQTWARAYEKRRGRIFCHDREAKHAAIDWQRTASNENKQFGKAAKPKKRQTRRGDPDHQAKPDRYGRDRTQARQPRPQPAMRTEFRQAANDAAALEPARIIEALTAQHSTFTRRDLARHIWTRCADAAEFRAVMAQIEAAPELVRLGPDRKGAERFTARDMQAIERQMMDDAITAHGRARHPVSHWKRLHALQALHQATGLTLTDEQIAAFQHVTGPDGIAATVGYAGSGKSTMLAAARLAWQASGYRVRGAALSGIAADGLQAGAGIDSGTIHSLLFALDKGRDALTAHDVLVVDEAGMIGSRLMARLLAHARQAGAKVVLVGDPEQLQAIDAGAAFRAILNRTGAAQLTAIRRQREDWQQQATRDLATGQTAAALERYAQADMLHGHATADAAKAALIEGWDQARQAHPDQTQIILAYTRKDVRDLNDQARAVRQAADELGPDHIIQTGQGPRHFATGDRLYFLKNDRKLDVRNGSLATVESIDGDTITARLDDGKRVSFSAALYNHIDHGYAATVHKSQGVTVDRAHVLATRMLDRHAAYVAMTRHRTRLDMHWSTDDLADQAALSRALGRDRAKDTTLDYEPAPTARTHGKPPPSYPTYQAS